MGAAMVVDVALGERGAQPTHEGAASAVGGERAAAFAFAESKTVKLGIEAVGEFAAQRVTASNGNGSADQGLAMHGNEALPSAFVAVGAGAGEHQV